MSEHTIAELLIRYHGPKARLLGFVRPRRLARWLMGRFDLPVRGECRMRCGSRPWRKVVFWPESDDRYRIQCSECGEGIRFRG